MKLSKLLDLLAEVTHAERSEQLKQCKQLKSTLKQLRAKCRDLEQKINDEVDADHSKELEEKLKIVVTKRKKGLELLKQLRDHKESS